MNRLLLILLLFPVFLTGQVNYSTQKTLYYVRTVTGHGAVPDVSKFKYTNDVIYNSTDSVGYIKRNGVVTLAYTIYPYSVGAIRLVPTVVKTSTATAPTVRSQYYVKTSLIPGNYPPLNNYTSSIVRCWNVDSTLWQKWNGANKKQYICYTFSPRVDPEPPTPPSFPTLVTRVYVSNSGSDSYTLSQAHNPLTPLKTIAKVNTLTLSANDTIFFKSGETFIGTITPQRNNLNYTSYGTGNATISGFTTITGWTNEGSGIYSKTISCEGNITNMITIDGVNTPMGRYPKMTWLTYEAHVGTTSITDNQLTNSPNWTGAEVVIRKNRWTIDRSLITNHNITVLSYTSGSSYDATDGFGYFFQNSLLTLTSLGDWFYNGSKLYMYFGAVDPATKVVKINITSKLYNSSTYDYIAFSNLSFEGGNTSAIFISTGATNSTIINCTFNNLGGTAIYAEGASYITATNNVISNCNGRGIYLDPNCHYSTVSYNTISNIGLFEGMGERNGQGRTGIHIRDNSTTAYNSITNVGYNGIAFAGSNCTLNNNIVNGFCNIIDDGAGIYTYGTGYTNKKVQNNIVINGTGNSSGTNNLTYYACNGIYLDDKTENVEVSGNTVANNPNYGLFLHNAFNCYVHDNTFYNNLKQIRTSCDDGSVSIVGNEIKHNNFFSKTSTQYSFDVASIKGDILNFFDSDSNYILRPIDDVNTVMVNDVAHTLAWWQSYSSQDANSVGSPFAVSSVNNILFDYATNVAKVVTIPSGTWKDLDGVTVTSVTLQPYTSVILLKQ